MKGNNKIVICALSSKINLKSKLILFFFLAFLFNLPAQAVAEVPSINIPAEFGKIDQTQTGTNGKTIVLIQSAHTNYAAQKSVAEILKTLVGKKLLHLILVEGGWGDVRLSYLRSYAPEKNRLEVAERYLKEGKISGEEYLDLTSDLDMMIWGIENPADYRINMEAFLKFYEVQNQLLNEAKKIDQALDQNEGKYFSGGLLDFLAHKRSFHENKSSLLAYLTYLVDQGDKTNINSFPLLTKLIAITDGQMFDDSKVEVEKKNLMKALVTHITKLELEQFSLLKESAPGDSQLNSLRLLLSAYEAYKSKLPKLKIENIQKCIKSLESVNSDSPNEVFNEVAGLEERVLNQFSLTEEQTNFIHLRQSLGLLKQLFSLSLTSKDFNQTKKDSALLNVSNWKTFLNQHSINMENINFDLISEWIPKALLFYEAARKREASLIKNADQKIRETQSQTVAVLAGGFHSEYLASEFHKLGYSLIMVSPRFSVSVDSAQESRQYFEILKYKWESGKVPASNLSIS